MLLLRSPLSADHENRVLKVLRVAKHQVPLAQTRVGPRRRDALVGIEDALSDQIAWLENAADGESEAELERAAWQPLRAA